MITNPNFKDNVILKVGSYAQLINKPEHGGLDLNETGIVIYPDGKLQFVYRLSMDKLERVGEAEDNSSLDTSTILETISNNLYSFPNKLALKNLDDGLILLSAPTTPLAFINLFKDDYTINNKMMFENINFQFLNSYEALISETDDGKLGSGEVILGVDDNKIKLNPTREMYLTGIDIDDLEPTLKAKLQIKLTELINSSPGLIKDFYSDIVILDPRSNLWNRMGYVIPSIHKGAEIILVDDLTPKITFDFDNNTGTNVLFQSIGTKNIIIGNKNVIDEHDIPVTELAPKTRFNIIYDDARDTFIVKNIIPALATENNAGLFLLTSLDFLLNGDHLSRQNKPYAVKFGDFKDYLISIYSKLKNDLDRDNNLNKLLNISNLPKGKDLLAFQSGSYHYISKEDLLRKVKISNSISTYIDLNNKAVIDIPTSYSNTDMWKMDITINSVEAVEYIAYDNIISSVESIYDHDTKIFDNLKYLNKVFIPIDSNNRNVFIFKKSLLTYHLQNNKHIVMKSPIDFSNISKLQFTLYNSELDEVPFTSTDDITITSLESNNISNINTKPVITESSLDTPKPLIEIDYGVYDDTHTNFNNNAYTKMYLDSDNILGMHYNKLIQKPIFKTCDNNKFINFKYQMNILHDSNLYARSIYDIIFNKSENTQNIIDTSTIMGATTNSDVIDNCNKLIELADIKDSNKEACIFTSELNNFLNFNKTNFENIELLPNDEGVSILDRSTGKMLITYYDKLINPIDINSFDNAVEETDGDKTFKPTTDFDDVLLSNSLSRYKWNIRYTITGISKDNEYIVVINNLLLFKDTNATVKYVKLDTDQSVDLSTVKTDEIPNTEYSILMTDYNNIEIITDNFIYIYSINNYVPTLFITVPNPISDIHSIRDIVYNKTLFILTDTTYHIGDVKYDITKYINEDNLHYLYLDLFGALNWIDIINPKDTLLTFDINLVTYKDERTLTTVDLYKSESFPELIKGDYGTDEFYDGGYLFKKCRYMIYDSKDPKKILLLVGDINSTYLILELDPDDGHIVKDVTSDYIFRQTTDPLIYQRIPALNSDILPISDLSTANYSLLIHKTDWDDKLGLINLAYIHNTTLVGDNNNLILYSVHTANVKSVLSQTNESLKRAQIEAILREQFYICEKTFIRLNVETSPLLKVINFVNPFPDYVPDSWSASDLSYLKVTGKITINNKDYVSIVDGTLIKNTPVEIDLTKSAFGNNHKFTIEQSNSNYITIVNNNDTMIYSYDNEDEVLGKDEIDIINFKKNKVILKLVNDIFILNIDGYNFNTSTATIATTDKVINKLFKDEINDEVNWFVICPATSEIVKFKYNLLTNTSSEDRYTVGPNIDKIENILYYDDMIITIIYKNTNDTIKIFDLNLSTMDFNHITLSDDINIRKYSTLVIRDSLYLITNFIADKALDIMYNISTIQRTNDYYKINYVSDLNEIRLNNLMNIDNINIIPDEYIGCYVSILNDNLILRLKDRSYINIISKFHFNKNFIQVKDYDIITKNSNSDKTLIAISSKELTTNITVSDNRVNGLTFIDDYNAYVYIDLNMGNIFYIDNNKLLPKKYKLIIYNYNDTIPTIFIRDREAIEDTVVLDTNNIEYNADINYVTYLETEEFNDNIINVKGNMIIPSLSKIDYTVDITDKNYNIADDGYLYTLSNTDVKKIKVSEYDKGDYIDIYDVTKSIPTDIIVNGYIISDDHGTKISIKYNNLEVMKLNMKLTDILYSIYYDNHFFFITKQGIYKDDILIVDQNIDKYNINLDDRVIYMRDADNYHTYDYRLNVMI